MADKKKPTEKEKQQERGRRAVTEGLLAPPKRDDSGEAQKPETD